MTISFLFPLVLFSLFLKPTVAVQKSYVVYLGEHTHGLEPTSVELNQVTNSHYKLLSSVVGNVEIARDNIFYSYTHSINGFAAVMDEEEAAQLAKRSDVVSVFPNKPMKLHTTHSWEFLRLTRDGIIPPEAIWKKARFGKDTIIGNLDTGVWPESRSFLDEGYGPIPSRWRGTCQTGNGDKFHCNRKLIGARYFNKGLAIPLPPSLSTVRDLDGHGSHTLSTAAGNFVPGANVFHHGNGTASGGSPAARVAAYKVCWPQIFGTECPDADILAAFDAAISDGVDVLSVSVGGATTEFFTDAIAIGSFHAVKNGITVVASAGNSGPKPGTVSNVAPWIFTIGASTIDREFTSYVKLGNKKKIKGISLSATILPHGKYYPLITGASAKLDNVSEIDANLCALYSLDPRKAKGKIVVCLQGENGSTETGVAALRAGAVGLILANDKQSGNEVFAEAHVLPAADVNFIDGQIIYAYINSTGKPTASITPVKTILGTKPAPSVATFSSRGPNIIDPEILKPDITAPGVDILASFTLAISPSESFFDKRRIPFNILSGTSMSCPHVSGVVGLLKTLYPLWSPAAIKSAIMTTARTRDNEKQPMKDYSTNNMATPLAYGAGDVRPNQAMDPGLVYDLTIDDYLNYLCGQGYNTSLLKKFTTKPHACPKSYSVKDFNYPSVSIPELSGQVSVTRRVKNVGHPGTYSARIKPLAGVSVSVRPKTLTFKKIGEEKEFVITFNSTNKGESGDFVFGQLVWSDGKHNVSSPIVIKHK
ncbi:hypothetical protein SLEP1_g45444 [Rubroshorea leprosula]|uniref:Uncharacterized protein n=1 Tax=Rubroshorea leprosula TaxID=152421 RepID=A0AAV5LJ62_9ROSI|nr:hypothetical protein SLEP1_g45444 [Rubroshorea leprosula]